MSTTVSFSTMLNEYLPLELLGTETKKRSYVLSNVEQDNSWKGGNLVVSFVGGNASSFSYGSLSADTDISEDTFVRGGVSAYKEIWGAMKWNGRDLQEHGAVGGQASGKISEQSFLKDLPRRIENFVDNMKSVSSTNFLVGTYFATLTTAATANDGLMIVDHPERFQVDQKVLVKDADATVSTGFVARASGINMETKVIKLVTARGGVTPVDFSGNNIAATTGHCYVDGAQTAGNAFTSLADQLLSSANGGSANLFGVAKVNYPYLQATNISGASWTSANVLEKLFDAFKECAKLGRGGKKDAVMSYDVMGAVLKLLEVTSGPFKNVKTEVSAYGYTKVTVVGVDGALTLVGVYEMDSDKVYFLDWSAIKLYTNGLFKIQEDPDGKKYFTLRATTGYTYIQDVSMFGELVVIEPPKCGVVYSIPALT